MIFTAVGDCIISRRVSSDPRLGPLADMIRAADAALANLEIMTPREPLTPSSEYGGMHLAAPPWVLDELRWCGFNLFHVANNHATDYTFHGLVDTLRELKARGMVYAGGGSSLGEARSPGYLETPAGRVALISAASSYVTGALAAERRTDMPGRPGVNPLRFERRLVLDAQRMAWLRDIDRALGTAAVRERQEAFGLQHLEHPEALRFLGAEFFEGDAVAYETRCNPRDLEEISRWIADARRQADLVVVSLHAHEGLNGDSNCPSTAEFVVEAAHAWIDAGADVFVGHGPHRLRPVEIYRGKPVFYSLGNFMFMFETIARLPAEMYERHKLPPTATPADVMDAWAARADGTPNGFHTDPAFWECVVPVCRFEGGRLREVVLHPVSLGLAEPRGRRGSPAFAEAGHGRRILAGLAEASSPLGTEIRIGTEQGRAVGLVAVP
jgi:poly-gamma-glutamate capsule biosynthesis protein CapA/YwtB (metallophosphatase superfamily)